MYGGVGMSVDFDHTLYLNLLVRTLVEKFHPKSSLDVGCGGGGELVNMLQKYGVKTYGIGISKQSLSYAKEAVTGALLCRADAENMPFKDDSFNLVIAHHVIEHLEKTDYFIKETKRILRQEGVVCIVVPLSPFGLTKLWKALKFQRQRDHISMHSRSFWIKAFEKEEFRLIGDLQEIVMKDSPSFWLGKWLINHDSLGRWLWLRIAAIIRGSFLFKQVDYQKEGFK